ncbi:MAG: hypothetical protein EZS28_027478 [Streblomastix strix]|uniref:Uncharacterized protein n=1 Tax=Streblomastix strix TaxID=222440 RepID=A0A5J4V4K1_9EUKA|nr:MAG: hypothetical protein EZS28_027478 [Streblomastix strix]
MNSSYGSDGMNTKKYIEIKVIDQKDALKANLSNTFMDEQQLSDNAYAVQFNPKTYTYKTPIQETYFVLDNAKFWYLNFIYNFMHKAFDMEKMHFVEGDTDSAYWAVSVDANAGYLQQFNYVIKDKQFYDENAKYYFPTIEGQLFDEKKILGLAIENEGTEIVAPASKIYYTKVGEKEKIKLKGVSQNTNQISKQNIVNNFRDGTITKATNMRLGQKNYIMSKIATQKMESLAYIQKWQCQNIKAVVYTLITLKLVITLLIELQWAVFVQIIGQCYRLNFGGRLILAYQPSFIFLVDTK